MADQTALFEQAKDFIPGGVHSPEKFKGLRSTPRFIKKGKGATSRISMVKTISIFA